VEVPEEQALEASEQSAQTGEPKLLERIGLREKLGLINHRKVCGRLY
jgi:hypothetical protein